MNLIRSLSNDIKTSVQYAYTTTTPVCLANFTIMIIIVGVTHLIAGNDDTREHRTSPAISCLGACEQILASFR